MTVLSNLNKNRSDANGVVVDFSFDFPIFDDGDLEVYYIDSDGVVTLKVLNTDYTVAIDDSTEGGVVTFLTAPANGGEVLIKRVLELTQPTDIPRAGTLREEQIEKALDRNLMLIQQLQEELDRCIQQGVDGEGDFELPSFESGKYIGWDTSGNLENKNAPTSVSYAGSINHGLDASKAGSPSVGDIYIATDTKKFYRCLSAGVWTPLVNQGVTTLASAATVDLGTATGEFVTITGTTGISSFGTSAPIGSRFILRFSGSLLITKSSAIVTPGGSANCNITTQAGDVMGVRYLSASVWVVEFFCRGSETGPKFTADKGGTNQSGIVTATATKVTFGVSSVDTHNAFDTTNAKWTPPMPGRYQINAYVEFTVGVDQTMYELYIYKNGSLAAQLDKVQCSGTGPLGLRGNISLALNGTDYIELYVKQSSGGDKIINGAANISYFQGYYIGI